MAFKLLPLYLGMKINHLIGNTILILLTACLILNACHANRTGNSPGSDKVDKAYQQALVATKTDYPFTRWRAAFAGGLEQYTEQNCSKAQAIFDQLIDKLVAVGKAAPEADKLKLFKEAVLKLNALNDETDGMLIETGEREDLCDLTNKISIAAGLNPKDYAEGEGIASEWREW